LRPGRHATVSIDIDGVPVEIKILHIDPRAKTVELELPTAARLGHRPAVDIKPKGVTDGRIERAAQAAAGDP
jgi:hypothetical protein